MIHRGATLDAVLVTHVGPWALVEQPEDLLPEEVREGCRTCGVPWEPGDQDHVLFTFGFVCMGCVERAMDLREAL